MAISFDYINFYFLDTYLLRLLILLSPLSTSLRFKSSSTIQERIILKWLTVIELATPRFIYYICNNFALNIVIITLDDEREKEQEKSITNEQQEWIGEQTRKERAITKWFSRKKAAHRSMLNESVRKCTNESNNKNYGFLSPDKKWHALRVHQKVNNTRRNEKLQKTTNRKHMRKIIT